ncbi:hypothetical protein [Azospirillum sp. sgz301742]
MTTTPISICQAALTRIGATPLASFTDGTAEAVVAQANYDTVKRAVLALYPWRCAMDTQLLGQLLDTPYLPWLKAWQRPSSALKVWAVRDYVSGLPVTFDVQGLKILSYDEAALLCDFGFDCDEAFLEPHVVEMVTLRMAAVFAAGLADRASMAQTFEIMAKDYFALAKTADAQGRTANRVQVGRWKGAR